MYVLPVLLVVPNVALDFTEFNSVWAKLANTFAPWVLYMLLCSLSPRIGRTTLFFVPLMVLCAFQIVLLFLYGQSIIAIDMFMNVLTTNAKEVGELLGNLMTAIVCVVAIYLPPIVAGVIFTVRREYAARTALDTARKLGWGALAVGVIFWIIAALTVPSFKWTREIFPYNVCSNMVTAVVRDAQSRHYADTSRGYTFAARSTRADTLPEVYVFVIGETARADNWQLFGYGRPTTPRLSARSGIHAYPKALTEINTTHKSVPMLMSQLNSTNFGDSVALVKSIFAPFNESGYDTYFISNQRRNGSYIDFYGQEADSAVFLTDGHDPHHDMILADKLAELLDRTTAKKVFVILHQYGSHFEYNKRYPRRYAQFQPDANSDAVKGNRAQLINAYDNTILYNDAVLDSMISTLQGRHVPAALVYVSDHGEDIFDDPRERFLHASPVPTYWQMHVPMIVWTSDRFNAAYPQMHAALTANTAQDVSSSRSVFHTLLDLAGVETPVLDRTQSLASDSYRLHDRRYLNDYNESVPLGDSGLRPYDFARLDSAGISISPKSASQR